MATATIKLFLVFGDPKRLRTAEISNWTGKAVAGPRSEFEGILAREETDKSGVYFLVGSDPDSGRPAIYIGEAESIGDRIKSHLERDFWNQVAFFVSKDENLTKAHIRYLEGKLIEKARVAARATVTNGQGSGARLPESDREDMEVFLARIRQLLPVLGSDLLAPIAQPTAKAPAGGVLFCRIKGAEGQGQRTANGFVVFKDSTAVLQDRPSAQQRHPFAVAWRKQLLADGTLAQQGDFLRFTKDTEFTSPSTAAAVIHGGGANGLVEWKTKDGTTLKELDEKA